MNVEIRRHSPKNTRWADDYAKVAGNSWMQAAQDQYLWKTLGKAYVQKWTFGSNYDNVVLAKTSSAG